MRPFALQDTSAPKGRLALGKARLYAHAPEGDNVALGYADRTGDGMEMEFRILGPLEIHSDGQALDLGGTKQRSLLAVLLLHANQVVSQDRLVDALWESDPPETAHKALQVHVSGLRKLLGKERLETRPPGYLLRVADDELDLERFRQLREQGMLAEALALWRGPPLSDFAYDGFAQAAIAQLEDQRFACLEERIDRELDAGRHGELTGELEALVAENPLRERLRGELMLALYRSGRQAEALEAYQQARSTLVDELGIEPGRELRALHQAILNQDPALELPSRPRQSAADEERAGAPNEEPGPVPKTLDREVRKTISALYVDVRIASAQQKSVDPEALRRVSQRTLDIARIAAEPHGGTVETAAGTTATIVFGLPTVHEDDALRAVRAASEIRDRLVILAAELRADGVLELDFRLGIGTGEVVAGGEGDGIGAIGEPLSRSSALAQAAESGAIVVDEPTRRLLRDAVVAEPADDRWRVVEVSTDLSLPSTRLASPMIGRERERRRLHDAFEQAVSDRSCQLFTVLGLAGVGKSRLVQEFLAGVAGQALVARGRCLPYGEGITFWPLLEAVKEAVGLDDSDSSEDALAKLSETLSEAGADETGAVQVSEMIGLVEATSGSEGGSAAVQTLFQALSRRQPLVLVFDDIHWGEPTFLDLLEYLAGWMRDAPILLICLARPELLEVRPDWGGGKLNATSILLEPLSDVESAQLICNLAGASLEEATRQRIVDASEGNPLFVEEMLALALEGGETDGPLVVPPTIQALLAARLDRLGEEERAVLDVAAVQGKVFYEEAVTALLSATVSIEVSSALGAAMHKELIRPERPSLGCRTYRFRHLLIRDAAYDSIPKEVRSDVHERFGLWLEHAAGERLVEYEEIVGYHLEQAYRYRGELGPIDEAGRALARDAAERLGAAGRRAFLRSDAPAGVNLISRAAALLPVDDPARVDLIPNVRTVQGMGGDMSWADKVLTEAVEAAATSGDRRLAAHALVQRGLLRLFTESDVTPQELVEVAERAIAVFHEFGDDLGLARAWRLTAQAHYLNRHLAACADASERALEHARHAGDRFEEREIAEWLVIALLLGPTRAADATRRCRVLLEEVADEPTLQAEIVGSLGALLAMQGEADGADECVERSRAMMEEAGESVWVVAFWRSFVYMWRGDPVAAEEDLRPGYEALKQIGERSHFSSLAHALSNALYLQGRYDEAEELTRECEASCRPNDVHSHIMWRAIRAKLFAQKGEVAMAERLARESVALAGASDFYLAHADALMDLAEVLTLRERRGEAARSVSEAIALYEQKGNGLAAARARERLAGLKE
jgi:DNA-binding SARP family transcriptional activator